MGWWKTITILLKPEDAEYVTDWSRGFNPPGICDKHFNCIACYAAWNTPGCAGWAKWKIDIPYSRAKLKNVKLEAMIEKEWTAICESEAKIAVKGIFERRLNLGVNVFNEISVDVDKEVGKEIEVELYEYVGCMTGGAKIHVRNITLTLEVYIPGEPKIAVARVVVTDKMGRKIYGAKVTVLSGNEIIAEKTAATGVAKFELKEGSYTFRAEAFGYKPGEVVEEVKYPEVEVRIKLEKSGSMDILAAVIVGGAAATLGVMALGKTVEKKTLPGEKE